MATSNTIPTPCLMCLDAPGVCKVGGCQHAHAFCEACLSSYQSDSDKGGLPHLPSKRQRQGTLPCPACKGHCEQVTAQVDNVGEDGTDRQVKEGGEDKPGDSPSPNKPPVCKICFYRGQTVRATKACVECRNIPMCPSCLQTHREKAETKHHVTGNILLNPSKQHCVAHGEQLDVWCRDCAVHICLVCVPLDHSDHHIEPLAEVIRTEAKAIQTALEFEQGRFTRLQSHETYLQESKGTAQDMEDTLIKAIEDHTEKVIGEALTNKKILKKDVRSTFEVIKMLAKRLDSIPEMLDVSKGIIARVEIVLYEEAEMNSAYVEKLGSLKQELEELKGGETDYTKEKDTYREAYEKLCKVPMQFYPMSPNMNIGGFKDLKLGPRCNAGGSCVCETCQKCFKFPHQNRVGECRDKGTCTCGTCGSVFDRSKLNYEGYCKKVMNKCTCNNRIANPYYP